MLGAVALVLVLAVGLSVLDRLRAPGAVDQAAAGPVILVPGYGAGLSSLDPLAAELRRDGRRAVVFEPTQGGRGDLQVQARRLADLARTTMKDTGASSVDVVGYSAGGVIARLFVKDDGGASVVRRVVTLGSPHHGTEVAALAQDVAGGCPTACEQLATDSDLLRRLNAGDETPAGPEWVTVRTTDDQTVTPSVSARLSGAVNVTVQDFCQAATTSHGDLPGDPVVLATLRSALGEGRAAAPTDVRC